jgi:hypothetical protein
LRENVDMYQCMFASSSVVAQNQSPRYY